MAAFIMSHWSHHKQLTFIDDYRALPSLWDTNSQDYRNRYERAQAYKMISRIYGITVLEAEKKIRSLRTIFRREHSKVLQKRAIGQTYKPGWFAYKAMLFVAENETQKDLISSGNFTLVPKTMTNNNAEEIVVKRERLEELPTDAGIVEPLAVNAAANDESDNEILGYEEHFSIDDADEPPSSSSVVDSTPTSNVNVVESNPAVNGTTFSLSTLNANTVADDALQEMESKVLTSDYSPSSNNSAKRQSETKHLNALLSNNTSHGNNTSHWNSTNYRSNNHMRGARDEFTIFKKLQGVN